LEQEKDKVDLQVKKMVRKKAVKKIKKGSIVIRNKRLNLAEQGQNMKDYDIAYDFASKVYGKFRELVKSIVLFGSVAKMEAKKSSDMDIIIIVDDATVKWDDEMIAWYRHELAELVKQNKYARRLHVNTVTVTTFWQEVMVGEPVVINVLRYGVALIDFGGFFEPLKMLLAKGKIKPSREAIFTALNRAPVQLTRAKYNLFSAVEAIYWGLVDASHAALMSVGVIPPSPEHVAELLEARFVKPGHLHRKYLRLYKEVFVLAHKVSRGEVKRLDMARVDEMRLKADKYIGVMAGLVKKFEIDAPHPYQD
tara:strand:- start:215 stop:1138 length:924 start_codon:yes stop_codon:yes gene_type:complete